MYATNAGAHLRQTLVITGLALSLGVGSAVAQEDDDEALEEIIVTGSQIRGANIADALAVSVVTSEEIEALGIDSGDELLEFMAEQGQNFFSESEHISGGVNSARGDIGAFNLRNLGTGNTLVLVNGRRMVNAASYQTESVGGSFIPVNTVNSQALPPTGLERIEILRDGASAVYGADAVAGMLDRRTMGGRKSGRQATFSSDILYDTLHKYDPDHLLMKITREEALRGLVDFGRIEEMLARTRGRVDHVTLDRVTPLAAPLFLEPGRVPVEGGAAERILAEETERLLAEAGLA